MSVGVIAKELTVFKPYNALCMQCFEQLSLNVFARHGLVSVRCHEATCGGENAAFAVAFNASAFQNKVGVVFYGAVKGPHLSHVACDGIVFLPVEFLSPAIEFEVEHAY